MKKVLTILCATVLCFVACFALIGCSSGPKFTLMDGDTQITVVKSKEDLKAELDKGLTKTGSKFLGWFTDKECTKEFDIDATYGEDVVLYAGWKDLDLFNRITLDADVSLGMNSPIPLKIDAGATVLYRETAEGVDIIVDLMYEGMDVKMLYVDGVLMRGAVTNGKVDIYYSEDIGTLKELYDNVMGEPEVQAILEFVNSVAERNGMEIGTVETESEPIFPANIDDADSVDLASVAQDAVDFLSSVKDEVVYEFILDSITQSQTEIPDEYIGNEDQFYIDFYNNIKETVDKTLTALLSDEITVEEAINVLLGFIDPSVTLKEFVFPVLDSVLEGYQIGTQEIVDLLNEAFGANLPDAKVVEEVEETLTEYLSGNGMLEFLDYKVLDVVKMISGNQELSLEKDILSTVKGFIENTTFGDLIDMIIGDGTVDMLSALSIEKLEISYGIKADENSLPVEISLGTNDKVSIGEGEGKTTYSLNASLKVNFEYGVYGEDVFLLPEVVKK